MNQNLKTVTLVALFLSTQLLVAQVQDSTGVKQADNSVAKITNAQRENIYAIEIVTIEQKATVK